MLENVLIIALLLAIVVGVVIYLIRAKKRGQTCIGCPYAKRCGGCPSTCNEQDKQQETLRG